jgi:Leucine-rich repeat (LRR) protein
MIRLKTYQRYVKLSLSRLLLITYYTLEFFSYYNLSLFQDVQRIIFSKLALKEVVRTSAVSRRWRYLWQVSPKLSFDGMTMCGTNKYRCYSRKQYVQKFIRNVYAVLIQCRGRVVEELAIKFDFDKMLASHLNNWVTFAVSSRTKFLALDLAPKDVTDRSDRYMFPFDFLDMGSISRLQKILLSFVSLLPPTQFSGFPNLQRLDLNLVHVNGKDLTEMLSNCRKLEWLRLASCHICDELKFKSTLTCLVYLNVTDCQITRIALQTVKLATFEYKGLPVPIDLSKSSELETADIHFSWDTLDHAIILLANVVTNVKHLTFNIPCKTPEVCSLMML